jgi:hypothetical protein
MKKTKLWHRKLGHVNKSLHHLNTKKVVIGVLTLSTLDETCARCMVGKQSRENFPPKTFNQVNTMVELIHTNICGSLSVPSMSRSRYFIIFIYDYSKCFGLATKARACKGAGQEGSPRVTSHAPRSVGECEGMNPHTPK